MALVYWIVLTHTPPCALESVPQPHLSMLLPIVAQCLQPALHQSALGVVAHGAEYLIRCHDVRAGTFVVQIGEPGDYVVDTDRGNLQGNWGLPDDMPPNRSACHNHCNITITVIVLQSLEETGCASSWVCAVMCR